MFFTILFNQLRRNWLSNLLLFITMTVLAALFVFILNTNRFSVRSMRLIMKNLGLNQVTIASNGNFEDAYLCTDKQIEIPEKITYKMAKDNTLLSKYYVSVLQKRIEVAGKTLLLTGIEPVRRSDETKEKSNPVNSVSSGTVRLGYSAAEALKSEGQDTVNILGRSFKIAQVNPLRGELDDFRIFINLKDAQSLLTKSGLINMILSFECLHVGGSLQHIYNYQENLLKEKFPEVKQVNIASIAEGRYHARKMTEKYLYYLLISVALIMVMVLVISGIQEVQERKYETGIFIAHGMGYLYIIFLYLLKTLFIAIAAGISGFIIGGYASVFLTTPFLVTNTQNVSILWSNLPMTVGIVVIISIIGELIPIIKLLSIDPCVILMEDS